MARVARDAQDGKSSTSEMLCWANGRPIEASIPRALLRDPAVSAQAKTLYALIGDHASPDRPVPWPGQQRLAGYLGVTPRTVYSWQQELVEAGWVTVQRTGRSNRFVLEWDHRSVKRRSVAAKADRRRAAGNREPGVRPASGPSPRSASGTSDRKQTSDRDRKQTSDQTGSRLPSKYPQEEEPGEVSRTTSSDTSRGGSAQEPPDPRFVRILEPLGGGAMTAAEATALGLALGRLKWPEDALAAKAAEAALEANNPRAYFLTVLRSLAAYGGATDPPARWRADWEVLSKWYSRGRPGDLPTSMSARGQQAYLRNRGVRDAMRSSASEEARRVYRVAWVTAG